MAERVYLIDSSLDLEDIHDDYVNRPVDYGYVPTFCRVVLVLLLRAGFIIIQVQCVPTGKKNILIKFQ